MRLSIGAEDVPYDCKRGQRGREDGEGTHRTLTPHREAGRGCVGPGPRSAACFCCSLRLFLLSHIHLQSVFMMQLANLLAREHHRNAFLHHDASSLGAWEIQAFETQSKMMCSGLC